MGTIGIGAAAPVAVRGPATDALVEGHTVFTALESDNATNGSQLYAAAVAILVREVSQDSVGFGAPGVLWFNDQYLIDPDSRPDAGKRERFPCTGAVMAVEMGAPDPRVGANAYNSSTYVESYHITDPNDNAWDIDKWRIDGPFMSYFVWTVAIMGHDQGYSTPDDGVSNCKTAVDGCPAQMTPDGCEVLSPISRETGLQPLPLHKDPGANGGRYTCGSAATCSPLRYNALLYLFMGDLANRGAPKNHSAGSTDAQDDASGCQTGTTPLANDSWSCPGDDDHREGNSHAFNPMLLPGVIGVGGAHGGSADCTGDGRANSNCHATASIDIYYGVAQTPMLRNYVIFDSEGATSYYHCDESVCRGPPQGFV